MGAPVDETVCQCGYIWHCEACHEALLQCFLCLDVIGKVVGFLIEVIDDGGSMGLHPLGLLQLHLALQQQSGQLRAQLVEGAVSKCVKVEGAVTAQGRDEILQAWRDRWRS